jgi:hypothetical protein
VDLAAQSEKAPAVASNAAVRLDRRADASINGARLGDVEIGLASFL